MALRPSDIQQINKVTMTLDSLLNKQHITRGEFTDVLNDAEEVATRVEADLPEIADSLSSEIDYLWKRYDSEIKTAQNKGFDVNDFNAKFLVAKLRSSWTDFVTAAQGRSMKMTAKTVNQRESRMSKILSAGKGDTPLNEDKRYETREAYDIVADARKVLSDFAGGLARIKTIALDYQNVNAASSIDSSYKRLLDLTMALEEEVMSELDNEEKKARKAAEKELEDPELPSLEMSKDVSIETPDQPEQPPLA